MPTTHPAFKPTRTTADAPAPASAEPLIWTNSCAPKAKIVLNEAGGRLAEHHPRPGGATDSIR